MKKSLDDKIMTYNELCNCLNESSNGYLFENIVAQKIDNFEMYQDIFSTQPLETKQGKQESYDQGEYVLIATMINNNCKENERKVITRLIFDGLEELKKIINDNKYDNQFLAPISFCGKNATRENARFMYALVIDLDNLCKSKGRDNYWGMRMFDYYISRKWFYEPNYMVVSGHGLHLYYVFERPIAMYDYNINLMYELKKRIIDRIWNDDIIIKETKKQYGNSIQNFRIAGTKTKIKGLNTQAYFINKEKFTPYMLAERTLMSEKEKKQYIDMIPLDRISLAEAKRKWPIWYQERIVEKKEPKRWHIKRALYDWYLREIKEKAQVSHRYYCCLNLVSYAQKCDIDYEELKKDLYDILPILDERTTDETNHFTEQDLKDALSCYKNKLHNFKAKYMEESSGFDFPKNKRNYRKQKIHLKIIRNTKEILRQEKEEKIFDYLNNGGDNRISMIMKNFNISKPTAIKYRRLYEKELK